MKPISYLFAFLTLLFINACKDDASEKISPEKGSISLKLNDAQSSSSGRKKDATDNLTKVLVTIEKQNGEVLYDLEELTLLKFGDDLVSEELELLVGTYVITKFFAADANNNVLFAAPIDGSELADRVDNPLPLTFTIRTDEVNNVLIEVVSVEQHLEPEDFGYASFGLIFPKPQISLDINTTVADDDFSGPLEYTFEVFAKNAEGEIKWSSEWAISDHGNIEIPSGFHRYTFVASKQGQLSHVQHYLSSDLSGTSELFFELIPEASDDFIVKELLDGQVKIIFPADRTKLYTRIELAEDFDIRYIWVDRDGASGLGTPIGQAVSAEVDGEYLNGNDRLIRNAVNIFDNKPFSQSADYKEYLDMSLSNYTKDFDRDVSIVSIVFIDYNAHFESFTYDWDFDLDAFFDYWCPIAGLCSEG